MAWSRRSPLPSRRRHGLALGVLWAWIPTPNDRKRGVSINQEETAEERSPIWDCRGQLAVLIANGESHRDVAAALGVSAGTVAEDVAAIRKNREGLTSVLMMAALEKELAVMADDEYQLRLDYAAADSHKERLWIFDCVQLIQARRARIIGWRWKPPTRTQQQRTRVRFLWLEDQEGPGT